MTYEWVDYDRAAVSARYDRLAGLIPFFEWVLFLPRKLRQHAVEQLALLPGDRVLEVGCGTGRNFRYLYDAVGPSGHIHGVDVSTGMLRKARRLCAQQSWTNVSLMQADAADFTAPAPIDGVLFGLSYNTMPHHLTVLHRMWSELRSGGRMVIMDAKLPPGAAGHLILPFSVWLMKRTLLGNPYIQPWDHLGTIAGKVEMEEYLFGSYYICRAVKP
jgi:demethylmenaquinone methyltransferase/2-methoxy-6-polyprenyl-1,4-benzoquinol methylase